ncbi:Outer membrane receptor for Fe3+-dicitrate [Empedobacter falsenii]|uniref:Outer membrane receptor for Fe3+-dicitrate n=2 Tax=Empedobacter falsenii TaxID=343874 RepID=A0A376G068_9FLAO|nr:Outer membrane receptor for Fe3+-dicitrate [Empedobacter falsenii]
MNGQPINGMEDGKIYWSNWQSMTDVANVIDVQRGLGSSKLAISSVGGTVNIVTRATDLKQGGFVRYVVGNDSYQKATVGYNTGMKGKWGASILLDYWTAHRKYARGTGGEGQSYFVSVGYKPNHRHQFNWMLFGAPQEHDQNYSKPLTTSYNSNGTINTPGYDITGRKGNSNYGFYNGNPLSLRKNYYHKPVTNLNWDWTINENASLSTVLYASMGRGGGTGNLGRGLFSLSQAGYKVFTDDGSVNWDEVERYNKTIAGGIGSGTSSTSSKGLVLRSSVNNHLWYGGITNFNYDTKKGWTFNVGADIRFYQGDHFQQVVNYLGLDGRQETNKNRDNNLINKTFKANPWSSLFNSADRNDRVNYDNSEKINYQGTFGQVEFANDIFSVFAQGALSNQSYQKFDRWNYNEDSAGVKSGEISYKNGEAKSKVRNKTGWNIKGGIALNISSENKVFFNAGKYSRQAFLDNVFMQNTVNFIDPAVANEEILGLEAGYKYSTRTLNVNAYYTKWENRADSYTANGYNSSTGFVQQDVRYLLTGITQLHKGIEVDFNAKVDRNWTIRGYTSVGDWQYNGNANYRIQDQNSNAIVQENKPIDLDGVKVGNAAQFTFGLGTKVTVTKGLSFDADFNYYTRLYGNVNVVDIAKAELAGKEYVNEALRPYAIVDFGMSYQFKLGEQKFRFRGNIKNLFNDQYLSRKDAYGYYWGVGRTFNAGVTYNF